MKYLLAVLTALCLSLPASAQVIDTIQVSAASSGGGCTAVASSCASFVLGQSPSVTLQVSGTFSGTLTFETTSDGTNWVAASVTTLSSLTVVTTTTSAGQFSFSNTGALQIRARATSWSSGTATVVATRGYSLSRAITGGSGGVGTVTSVDVSVPSFLSAAGGPITTSGTIAVTLATENANTVFAGPSTGAAAAPTFRTLVAADVAGLTAPVDATYITQTANSTLTNEQALSSLSSGIMRVATTTGVITSLTTSAGIAANISDETGSGALVFATSPALVTPTINGLTYPAADGSSGDFISTNGSGVLSFTTPTSITVNNIKFKNGKGVQTDINTNDTLLFQAWDTNDALYRTFATLTAANTPSFDISAPSGGTVNVSTTTLSIGGTSIPSGVVTEQVGFTVDGAGSVITTGVKGFITIPYNCTIVSVTVLSTDASVTSGSIVVDIWKDTYANYPPTVADTITASAKPTLSSATKSQDTTLTGWTTTITAGDVLGFKVDSASTVTRVTLILKLTKT